jgi:hypothetical protein
MPETSGCVPCAATQLPSAGVHYLAQATSTTGGGSDIQAARRAHQEVTTQHTMGLGIGGQTNSRPHATHTAPAGSTGSIAVDDAKCTAGPDAKLADKANSNTAAGFAASSVADCGLGQNVAGSTGGPGGGERHQPAGDMGPQGSIGMDAWAVVAQLDAEFQQMCHMALLNCQE